jgi:hypothetical protein
MATNMVSQGILPQSVQQVAVAGQLGAFTKVYKSAPTGAFVGAIILMVVAAFSCAGAIFLPDMVVVTRVILLAFGLLFLGGAISQVSSAIQVANQRIYLFQQGMVIDKGKQIQVLPWNQVSEVWQSITRHYRNGSYTGTTYLYTLRRADGYQIKLNNLTKDIAELGLAVAQGTTRELVPRALQTIQAGQTLTFAPFSVNQQGISNGRDFLPWSQVQAVDVNRGYVTVKKAGTSRNWGATSVAKIPNFLVFSVVAEEMIRRTRGGK